MSLTSQQYADLSKDSYVNREIGVRSPAKREFDIIDGVKYEILEHYRNGSNGYAGTIYQRVDTGDIVVAHRGTETNLVGMAMDGAYTDGSMVLGRVNPQAQDAIELTHRAMLRAERIGQKTGHTPEVTVTGHSLGGCLAEITGHHFDLRGETFNAYGAASLGLRIPEGGDRMINHVMAADFVSAGSPHYGRVRVYASQQEIDTLERFGYENDRSHFDIRMKGVAPLITAGSHGINNFVEHPGGHSILADPDAPSRAHRYAPMIDKFRDDVREQRGALSVVADVARGLVGAAPEHHVPLTPGEPALRAGEIRERVVVPPIPAELREGPQAPAPAQPHTTPSRDAPRSDAPERMSYPPVPDYLRDADRTSSLGTVAPTPNITDRDHPGHARYQQALDAIERSPNIPPGIFSGERLHQAAANVAYASLAEAERPQGGPNERLGRIDFVVFNQDRSGLIAGQGGLGDPLAKLAFLPAAQDNATSLTDASRLTQDTLVQQQMLAQQQPPPTLDNPTPDGPTRGARV